MLIKYYDTKRLSYTTRQRFVDINKFVPFNTENQKSVLLGDGAHTTIKTSVDNICEYVTINNTRWFVTSYTYLNGKQVQLNLQRDVIGEFGINNFFGKIERGYTETFLRNKKELQLNQILKDRKPLIPNQNIYGNYSINTHENELWGVLYLTRPTQLDPNTGKPYPEQVNINIPAFAPQTGDLPFIEEGQEVISGISNCQMAFGVVLYNQHRNERVEYNLLIKYIYTTGGFRAEIYVYRREADNDDLFFNIDNPLFDCYNNGYDFVYKVGEKIANDTIGGNLSGYSFPGAAATTLENIDRYNNVIVKNNDKYYRYTVSEDKEYTYGTVDYRAIASSIVSSLSGKSINVDGEEITYNIDASPDNRLIYSEGEFNVKVLSYKQLSQVESGSFYIDVSKQLIDEPYIIMVCPLFDVTINNISNTETYDIDRTSAFMIFNTIIQYLSGENPYLVDAQIYPYCPVLTNVANKFEYTSGTYPIFAINSTSYTHNCEIQLLPSTDIKKEYIEREYTIVSPEQTGRFTFDFYDYTNNIVTGSLQGKNYETLNVIIKTALKPFAIIASAVIQPKLGSLKGITYESDLRGSQPSSNGFQCSLSSNAFETYKRQNSNYQAIFNKQQEQLERQHKVEIANDVVQTVAGIAGATAFGAIAGGEMADVQIFGSNVSKAAGATAGALVAGGASTAAYTLQNIANAQLRDYEKELQKFTFDMNIGTIKNLPNSINRISSFNEIILRDFWFVVEVYECSEEEKEIVNRFISYYSYGIGVFDSIINYWKNAWFLRSTLVRSTLPVNLHLIAENELAGGIYLIDENW